MRICWENILFVDKKSKRLLIDIPLASPTGKIRVKSRRLFHEYGIPHATRQKPFTQDNYVEWQISYDLDTKKLRDDPHLSTLPDMLFMAHNSKQKVFYELSEYLYYFLLVGFYIWRGIKWYFQIFV